MRRVLLSAAGAALLHCTVCSPAESVLASMPDLEDDLYDEDLPGIDAPTQYAYGYGDDLYDDGDEDPERWTERARALFSRLDTDGDGRVAASELRMGLSEQVRNYHARAHASSMAEVENVLAAADTDKDGVLTAAEFADARTLYVHHEMHLPRDGLFAFADASADGRVDTAELASLIFPEHTARRARHTATRVHVPPRAITRRTAARARTLPVPSRCHAHRAAPTIFAPSSRRLRSPRTTLTATRG